MTLLAFTLAACGGDAAPPTDQETILIALLNEKRIEVGCTAVDTNEALAAAAQRRAADMRQNAVREHTGSDGSTPDQRIAHAGFAASATGEILDWSTKGGAHEAVTAWMNSTAHRDVIRDCRFTHAVIAETADEREYVAVAAFGALR